MIRLEKVLYRLINVILDSISMYCFIYELKASSVNMIIVLYQYDGITLYRLNNIEIHINHKRIYNVIFFDVIYLKL